MDMLHVGSLIFTGNLVGILNTRTLKKKYKDNILNEDSLPHPPFLQKTQSGILC